jgi:hypothetical protein
MPRGHLDAASLVDRGMLDEGDEAAGHEAAGAYRLTGPRHLAHLNDPARCDDLDATTRPRGDDLERLDALPSVDHCFDSVTLHGANDTPAASPNTIRGSSAGARQRLGIPHGQRTRYAAATSLPDRAEPSNVAPSYLTAGDATIVG